MAGTTCCQAWGNDKLHGGDEHDRLEGGTGDGSLWGNAGDDLPIGGLGADTIIGFEVNNGAERIDLSLINGITDLTDLIDNHMSPAGAHVVIDDLAGNTITIQNVALADLPDGNDFLYAQAPTRPVGAS